MTVPPFTLICEISEVHVRLYVNRTGQYEESEVPLPGGTQTVFETDQVLRPTFEPKRDKEQMTGENRITRSLMEH